jgi:hypothetical protein
MDLCRGARRRDIRHDGRNLMTTMTKVGIAILVLIALTVLVVLWNTPASSEGSNITPSMMLVR